MADEQLVFVYGTLKEGGPLHPVLQRHGGQFIGEGSILGDKFVMVTLGNFPGIIEVEEGTGTEIHGELWLVNTECVESMDSVEGCPTHFKRERQDIWLPLNDNYFPAWVYRYNAAYDDSWHDSIIDDGVWPVSYGIDGFDYFGEAEESEEDRQFDSWPACETQEENPCSLADAEFDVDQGIYLVSDYGEMTGPYVDIGEALRAFTHNHDKFTGDDCVTVGFRMVRKNLSELSKQDIARNTYPPLKPSSC